MNANCWFFHIFEKLKNGQYAGYDFDHGNCEEPWRKAGVDQEVRQEHYYISEFVRTLWLVNLAGRTILHEPLKCVVFVLPNCCVIYHQFSSTYEGNNSLNLSFTLNCVLKRANNLKTISNWLVLLSTWFRNLKLFLMNGNRSRIRHTHNRDIINILLTSSSLSVL